MPEFLSPGVFIEEVDAGPKPIEGVSTSTAGAVGVTTFGPTSGKPVLVTSFAEFVRIFGPPVPEPTDPLIFKLAREDEGGRWWQFALSIKGFFDNGGQRIFVKRVFSKTGARAAKVEFGQGLLSELDSNVGATATTLKLRHLIGISKRKPITIFDPDFVGAFEVLSYDALSRTIRLDRPVGKALQAGKSFVQIEIPQNPQSTFTVQAKALGSWGNDLQAQVRPMLGTTVSLLPDPALLSTAFKTTTVSSLVTWSIQIDDATALVNDEIIHIKGRRYKISGVRIETTDGTGTFKIQSPPPDVLTREEALGTVTAQIQRTNGFSAPLKTALPATGGNVLDFDVDIPKLKPNDRVLVGNDPQERRIVSVYGTNKKITVDPGFTGVIIANTSVKKVSANVVIGGTLTKNTLKDLGTLRPEEDFIFVPTGKKFKAIAVDSATKIITIAPAIPLGFDWIGRPIQKLGPKAAEVAVKPAANDTTLKIKNVTTLNRGDFIRIGSKRYVLTTDPVPPTPPAVETTIQVAPPFAKDDLPEPNVPIFKLESDS